MDEQCLVFVSSDAELFERCLDEMRSEVTGLEIEMLDRRAKRVKYMGMFCIWWRRSSWRRVLPHSKRASLNILIRVFLFKEFASSYSLSCVSDNVKLHENALKDANRKFSEICEALVVFQHKLDKFDY